MNPRSQSNPEGLIIRSQSGFLVVRTESEDLICQLRGRLKQGRREQDIAAVGDHVVVTKIDEGRGMIEKVKERKRTLSRMAPSPRGEYRQIIIANPDQTVFVFSCSQPEPRLGMLDRFLVIAEKQGIPAVIVANKIDLVGDQSARELFGHYSNIGYPLLYTSALEGDGIPELHKVLVGKISVFVGPSGAGKSSILNAIQPELGLHVQEVSQATSKGKHTTVVREMFPLKESGYVADTPGLKALALWDITAEELDGYFPELSTLVAQCQFSNCTHIHEPGCAVINAVENGEIHPGRYKSYLRMRSSQQDQEEGGW